MGVIEVIHVINIYIIVLDDMTVISKENRPNCSCSRLPSLLLPWRFPFTVNTKMNREHGPMIEVLPFTFCGKFLGSFVTFISLIV